MLCLERLPYLVYQPCGKCVNIVSRHTSRVYLANVFSSPSSVFHHVATTPSLHFSLCVVGQWLTAVQRLLRSSPVSFDSGAHWVCRLCVAQSACACWFVAYSKFEFRFRIGGMLSSLDDSLNLGEKKVREAFDPLFAMCKWNDCQCVAKRSDV